METYCARRRSHLPKAILSNGLGFLIFSSWNSAKALFYNNEQLFANEHNNLSDTAFVFMHVQFSISFFLFENVNRWFIKGHFKNNAWSVFIGSGLFALWYFVQNFFGKACKKTSICAETQTQTHIAMLPVICDVCERECQSSTESSVSGYKNICR